MPSEPTTADYGLLALSPGEMGPLGPTTWQNFFHPLNMDLIPISQMWKLGLKVKDLPSHSAQKWRQKSEPVV